MYENVKILSGKRSKYYHFFVKKELGAMSSSTASSPCSFSALLEAIRSIRSGEGCKRPVASNWAMGLIELRGRLRDPRSRLLKSGDGERGFAFTRKNLCHSFNGAAHWHPAFPRDCNVRFDSLRRRINFILRLSSCTRALRRFSPEECSREAQLSKKVWTLLIAE